jgi:hypothetical protein
MRTLYTENSRRGDRCGTIARASMTRARALCFSALLFAAIAAAGGCTLIAGLPDYTLGTGGGDLDGGTGHDGAASGPKPRAALGGADADGSGGGW